VLERLEVLVMVHTSTHLGQPVVAEFVKEQKDEKDNKQSDRNTDVVGCTNRPLIPIQEWINPAVLRCMDDKSQEHVKHHDSGNNERVDGLERVSVEDQLKDRESTVQCVNRNVLPISKRTLGPTIAEQGPEDNRDNKVEGYHGGIKKPMDPAPPWGPVLEPLSPFVAGLSQIPNGP